jgi:hypothetical protein
VRMAVSSSANGDGIEPVEHPPLTSGNGDESDPVIEAAVALFQARPVGRA